jgi:hypothetical protein
MDQILREDIQSGFIRNVMSMKKQFYENRFLTHEQFNQKWLMSEYLYQLLIVVVELLDYLIVVTETVVLDERQKYLRKKIRTLLINIESISKDGFMMALTGATDLHPNRGHTGEAIGGDENLDEVDSERSDPPADDGGKESTRQISFF